MIGDVISQQSMMMGVARANRVDPSLAATKALAAYLLKAEFFIDGGSAKDTSFFLTSVKEEWPSPTEDLNYPTASIIESGEATFDAHNLAPTPIEETIGVFDALVCDQDWPIPKSVLWKEGEISTTFQVDFFASSKPQRQAIYSRLGQLFNPSEERAGVLLEGPVDYFSLPARFTLLSAKRDDSRATAYSNEWRVRCSVQCEIDIVSLRRAVLMQPSMTDLVITDPNDPEE